MFVRLAGTMRERKPSGDPPQQVVWDVSLLQFSALLCARSERDMSRRFVSGQEV